MGTVFKRFFVFAALAPFLAPHGALADDGITITEAQTLTFPKMGVPTQGSVNLSVSPLNSVTSGTAEIISGTASRGQYNLSIAPEGDPVSISIDISGVDTGHSGLTLDNFKGYYANQTIDSFPSATLPLPQTAPASTPLYLGARLTANASVVHGTYNAGFSITVFIQ